MRRCLAAVLVAAMAWPAAAQEHQPLYAGFPDLPAGFVPAVAGRPVAGFVEEEVAIPVPGWTLRGKIALPAGSGPLTPAFVLVHGSGAADMDGTTTADTTTTGKPAHMLADISDALAKAGFVVLRYDKRGLTGLDAKDQPLPDESSYLQYPPQLLADDAAAAVRFLRSGRSARRPVIILGHSEGTRLAPMIARRVPVQGLVLLGAMARPLSQLMHYQAVDRDFANIKQFDEDSDGFLSKQEAMVSLGVYLIFAAVDVHDTGRVSLEQIRQYLEARFDEYPQGEQGRSAWYQGHLRLPPNTEALPRYRGPILIEQGDVDDFTPVTEASLLEKALRDSGHPDFQVHICPGLGHDFSKPLAPMMPSAGPIEPQVLDDVVSWAQARFQN